MTSLKAHLLDFPPPGTARRWTPAEVDALKALLNRFGLQTVSSAIGSMEFDLVDAHHPTWTALSAEAPEGEGAGREAGAICGTGDPRMPGCGHARSGHNRQVSMIPRWGWSTIGCDLCPCTAFLSPPDPAPAVSPPGQSGEGPDCLCRGCGEVAATRWVYTQSGVGYAMCPDCTLPLSAPQVEGGAPECKTCGDGLFVGSTTLGTLRNCPDCGGAGPELCRACGKPKEWALTDKGYRICECMSPAPAKGERTP